MLECLNGGTTTSEQNTAESKLRRSHIDVQKLPPTLKDALRQSSCAIVVTATTQPFQVCNVNKAWEGLCWY
jgi:hypothetical protein